MSSIEKPRAVDFFEPTSSLLGTQPSFFRTFFERSPIGLNLSRMDGTWIISNPTFLKIIGYTSEQANYGQLTYWQLTPKEYLQREREQLEILHSTRAYGPYEKEFIRKDGSRVPVRLNGFIVEEAGEPYIWSMIEDIRHEKFLHSQATQAARFKQDILENLPAAIFIKDSFSNWEFTTWNKAAEDLFGVNRENILGKTDYDLFPADQADFFRNQDKLALSQEQPLQINEERINISGKSSRWLRTKKVALKAANGEARYLLGISEDITEQRAYNRQLETINKQLQEAKEAAHRASQSKSMFLSNMSHEIRTPLNSIIGLTDLLEATDLSQRQTQYVELLNKAGKHLMDIVDDIIDFHRIESNNLEPSLDCENVSQLLKAIVRMMLVLSEKANLDFETDIDLDEQVWVITDGKLVTQIFTNIISNAIKFTPSGGKVRLSAKFVHGQQPGVPDRLEVTVTDTGVGIPTVSQKHIFEPFEQVDSSVRKRYGGAGLGLAIVRRAVNILGGEINLNSEENSGSSFHIALPMQSCESPVTSSPTEPETADTSEASAQAHLKVLLADDVSENRWLVTEFLRNEPFELVIAENGEEAFESYVEHQPHIVLMDIGMPVMDGYQASAKIRAYEQDNNLPRTPIVALTGYVRGEDVERCIRAGCDDHLAKPFFKKNLVELINKYLTTEAPLNQPPAVPRSPSQ